MINLGTYIWIWLDENQSINTQSLPYRRQPDPSLNLQRLLWLRFHVKPLFCHALYCRLRFKNSRFTVIGTNIQLCNDNECDITQGLYSLRRRRSYNKTLRCLEAARFRFKSVLSLWNLTGNSTAAPCVLYLAATIQQVPSHTENILAKVERTSVCLWRGYTIVVQ